jgi:6-phosphogluconolactonase (cycloisomerase 2 family)
VKVAHQATEALHRKEKLMKLRTIITLAVVSLLIAPAIGMAKQRRGTPGAVYTMSNAADGNEVVVFARLADGSLRFSATYDTAGLGSGDGLGNQGGVVLSDNGRWLLVVNAGSNQVSVFSVKRRGLTLVDTVSSGGVRPISVAIHRDLVYVVHAGGSVGNVDSIAGLRLGPDGTLSALPGSSRLLSDTNTAPAQIGFSPDGRFLVVTEKDTNLIDVFPVEADGYAGLRVENSSVGQTPFAFDFGRRDQLFVAEVFGGAEDAGAVSSYDLEPDGNLQVIDGSVPNTETAPCWLVVTSGGRYAFTTNTPDDSLSAYAIDFEGRLELLDEDGRSGEPGAGTRPLDMDLSDDGRFLYTLNIGDDTISTFRVMPDGSLNHLGAIAGVPDGANGLAAR